MNEIITKVRSRNIKTILTAVVCQSSGGGASTFLGLTDAPDSYSGQASKVVSVKTDETGLEFTTGGSGDISGTGTANEVAYFTTAKTIASLPVSTYPNLTELSYIKGLRARPSRTMLYRSVTTQSITGTTAQTLMDSFLIPGGTIQVGDVINLVVTTTKTGVVAGINIRLNFNTTNSISGSTSFAILGTGATALFSKISREILVKSLTSQVVVAAGSSQTTDFVTINTAFTDPAINFNSDVYLIVNFGLGNAADIGILQGWYVELIRQ